MGIITNHIDFTRDYTQLPNAWLRDSTISHRARGLLAEVMTNRDGWDTSVEQLVKNGTEGRQAVRAAIKELVDAGYLRKEVVVREGGGLAGSRYVTQSPERPVSGRPGIEHQRDRFLVAQESPPKNTKKKNTKKNTNAPADADALFEDFWAAYPATRKGGKHGTKGAHSAYTRLAKELTEQGILDRMEHYKRTRAKAERSGEFVPNVPYATTWLNQRRWDDFGTYKPGHTTALTAEEIEDILGPDTWTPPKPEEGFEDVQQEMAWRREAYAARLEERRRDAMEVTRGTVRQGS